MGSPLSSLLANVFLCSIEDKLDQDGKLPSYYRRYVNDTFTIMPDIASAGFLLLRRNPAKGSEELRSTSIVNFAMISGSGLGC